MGENLNIPENRLAKWLEGTLTPKQLEAFENTEDFKIYQKIVEGTKNLQLPKPNLKEKFEQQLAFNKTIKTPPKVIKIKTVRPWMYAVAASVLVFIGLRFYLNQDTVYTTGYAENKTIKLPDHSEVILNAGSELRFDKDGFLADRVLNLSGEAFFKVEKGRRFKVNTPQGSVQVLGTKFNVYSRTKTFKVFCDEGKVFVVSEQDSLVLTQGMGAMTTTESKLKLTSTEIVSPQWRNGKLIFYRTPLAEVVAELELQFNISIIAHAINQERLYTGTFQVDDLETALSAVCIPMNISYAIEDNTVQLQNI